MNRSIVRMGERIPKVYPYTQTYKKYFLVDIESEFVNVLNKFISVHFIMLAAKKMLQENKTRAGKNEVIDHLNL